MANNIINTLKKIGRYLIAHRIEPHVRQKGDRCGNSYLSSEQEIRARLDHRYAHG